jgi:hypothetical protein
MAAPSGREPVEQEQNDQTNDGGQPGRDVEKLVQRMRVEKRSGQEAAQECPAMPMIAVTMRPPGSSPGSSALAIVPARSPRMMNAMMPMCLLRRVEVRDVNAAALSTILRESRGGVLVTVWPCGYVRRTSVPTGSEPRMRGVKDRVSDC